MLYRDLKKVFTSNNVLIYIAMSMLSKDKKNVLPELMYTFDRKDLLKIITVFGGEKIYIPTPTEFKFYMDSAMAFYYFTCKNLRWPYIQKYLELTDKELKKVREQVLAWSKTCSKEEKEMLRNFSDKTIRL